MTALVGTSEATSGGVTVDLVVVGAGAAGLLGAVAAKRLGLDVLIIEVTDMAGGATATSSGTMWLPGNPLAAKLGVVDSPEDALEYLNVILGPTTDASTDVRRAAYANTAGRVARWLMSSNLPLVALKGVPDHHPAVPGGRTQGRVLGTQPVDRRPMGEWAARLRSVAPLRPAGRLASLPLAGRVFHPAAPAATRGEALGAELLRRATANGVEIWFECPLVDLVESDGRITGVVTRKQGEDVLITARRGVLLASGGFGADQRMREEYLPLPTDAAWSLHEPTSHGVALGIAASHGAALGAMQDAWWVPVIMADGKAYRVDRARRAPHSIVVDQAGDRFFDEAAAPTDAVRHFYDHRRTVNAVPCYLIMDDRHRRVVDLGPWKAGTTPRSAIDSGQIARADSLNDLAETIGIDRAGLLGSVVRFNGFAIKGHDLDFRRGESEWDRYGLDASKKRHNPGLGKLTKSPFWAVPVYPGDEGTKGGLLIDEDSRVLRDDHRVIDGLYACGGSAASIMTDTSPGPGAALGEALVEAYRAVLDLTGSSGR